MNPYTEYNYNSDLLCDIRRMIAIYTSQIAYDSMADMFIRRKFTHNWTLRFGEVWWSVHDRSTDAPHGSAHIRQNGECNYEFHVWIRSWCGDWMSSGCYLFFTQWLRDWYWGVLIRMTHDWHSKCGCFQWIWVKQLKRKANQARMRHTISRSMLWGICHVCTRAIHTCNAKRIIWRQTVKPAIDDWNAIKLYNMTI